MARRVKLTHYRPPMPGNVFEKASDLDLKLRHSVGVGLRYDSVVGLLRVDLGFPLGRRAGERAYRVFFGLGQAF